MADVGCRRPHVDSGGVQLAPQRTAIRRLAGLNKAQTVEKHGAEQVKIWRRSFDIPPPALAPDDPRHPRFDPRYAGVDVASLPAAESLKDTLARVLPYGNPGSFPNFGR